MNQQRYNKAQPADYIGLIVMAVVLVAMALFFFFAFIAFVLTIIAALAWSKPLALGPIHIEPARARAFIKRGLLGAVSLILFVAICAIMMRTPLQQSTAWVMMAIGYCLGSVGIEAILVLAQRRAAPAEHPVNEQSNTLDVPRRDALPSPTFTYASWDDEEERRS
ncbi:hypothetical protein O9Z70_11905 [Devosia sp. YIM 151766]|uniref:hypothetical protein n=1 Tax=Devosia sp. YIM 151766 TaxID=3017325 RepID=UPI00255CE228|nr:hypothetical protein [Devosia sp. YIM 151766]WIY52165.1 hypothetical protein O9Z70_11905 [Devosia sp. YIM 151766]